eukprot:5752859-Pleurochrysis_carterae.AAC.2
MRSSPSEGSSSAKRGFDLDSSSMMPRIPVSPLFSVVELFSSETRYVNSDGGCPPVDTPCTRPSCSSMTHM